jgi:hypothetical protein
LYRHALESVLAFINFVELKRAVHVNRLWREAVIHMAPSPIAVVRKLDTEAAFDHLMASTLVRHVGSLATTLRLVPAQFAQLVIRMPALTCLDVSLDLTQADAFLALPCDRLPVALRELRLDLSTRVAATPVQLCAAAAFAARLPSLDFLWWQLTSFAGVDFSPLADAPSLRRLELRSRTDEGAFSHAQINQLRALRQLVSLNAPLPSPSLLSLLAAPCPLTHLEHLVHLHLWDDASRAALAHVPSFTRLSDMDVSHRGTVYLRGLPRLRYLELAFLPEEEDPPPLEEALVIVPLKSCRLLSNLSLNASQWPTFVLTAAQLADAFVAMPLLEHLTLRLPRALDSLRFLRVGTLPTLLRCLYLTAPGLHAQAVTDAADVFQLHVLYLLSLSQPSADGAMAVDPLAHDPAVVEQQLRDLFRPRSECMPALMSLQLR